jgi:hypothetical protein
MVRVPDITVIVSELTVAIELRKHEGDVDSAAEEWRALLEVYEEIQGKRDDKKPESPRTSNDAK